MLTVFFHNYIGAFQVNYIYIFFSDYVYIAGKDDHIIFLCIFSSPFRLTNCVFVFIC